MKAYYIQQHGGPEVMAYTESFPDPAPRAGEVVLRVRATTLNYHDVFTRRGMPGIKIPLPVIPGLDVSGEIVEIGPEVQGWKRGDRVLVDPMNRVAGGLIGETTHGGLAEYCAVPEHQLIALPEGVSFDDAAVLPTAYGTAVRMMYTNGRVDAGEKVLVLGASGGVGVCCVQLAKLVGAEVIACAGSNEKANKLQAIGADRTINYQDKDFVAEVHAIYGKPNRRGAHTRKGVDVVVNYTGGDTWVKSLKVLRVGGRLLTCGATAGFAPVEDLRYIWAFELNIQGSNGYRREDILQLLDLVQRRRLQVVIDERFTLKDAGEAFARIEDRRMVGKVVINP
jgi:alcohol dehydrogenase